MDLRRVRFVTAQLGNKAGKHAALAALLSARDLPAGAWQAADERTWRTGVTGPSTPWGERARQADSITAWRSFRDTGSSRWAWVQVTPLASAEDAAAALAGLSKQGLANLRSTARLLSESDVPVQPFAGASAVWAREQRTDGPAGPGLVLIMAAAVGSWLLVLSLSGSPAWDWQAASELAGVQAEKLSAPW